MTCITLQLEARMELPGYAKLPADVRAFCSGFPLETDVALRWLLTRSDVDLALVSRVSFSWSHNKFATQWLEYEITCAGVKYLVDVDAANLIAQRGGV